MIRKKTKKSIIAGLTLFLTVGIIYCTSQQQKVLAAYDSFTDMVYKHTDPQNNNENTKLNDQSCDYQSNVPNKSGRSTDATGGVSSDEIKDQLQGLSKVHGDLNSGSENNASVDELVSEQNLLNQQANSK